MQKGLTTVGLVASASVRELAEVQGLSSERAETVRKKARTVDPRGGIVFALGVEIARARETKAKITTGSPALDAILGEPAARAI